jgi:hypothetical protein
MVQITSGSDATEKWLRTNAARARRALANPAIRATVSALLVGSDPETQSKRRREEVERELAGVEVSFRLREELH